MGKSRGCWKYTFPHTPLHSTGAESMDVEEIFHCLLGFCFTGFDQSLKGPSIAYNTFPASGVLWYGNKWIAMLFKQCIICNSDVSSPSCVSKQKDYLIVRSSSIFVEMHYSFPVNPFPAWQKAHPIEQVSRRGTGSSELCIFYFVAGTKMWRKMGTILVFASNHSTVFDLRTSCCWENPLRRQEKSENKLVRSRPRSSLVLQQSVSGLCDWIHGKIPFFIPVPVHPYII